MAGSVEELSDLVGGMHEQGSLGSLGLDKKRKRRGPQAQPADTMLPDMAAQRPMMGSTDPSTAMAGDPRKMMRY